MHLRISSFTYTYLRSSPFTYIELQSLTCIYNDSHAPTFTYTHLHSLTCIWIHVHASTFIYIYIFTPLDTYTLIFNYMYLHSLARICTHLPSCPLWNAIKVFPLKRFFDRRCLIKISGYLSSFGATTKRCPAKWEGPFRYFARCEKKVGLLSQKWRGIFLCCSYKWIEPRFRSTFEMGPKSIEQDILRPINYKPLA